jgi:hypothetical protein
VSLTGATAFPIRDAPAEFQKQYREREIELRANVPTEKRTEAAEILRGYYAHMAALDSCFERLFRSWNN